MDERLSDLKLRPEFQRVNDENPLTGKNLTRADLTYPAWIDILMWGRWGILLVGGIIAYAQEGNWTSWTGWGWWFGAVALFFVTPHAAYRAYRRSNRWEAEIVFHNEKDGYCNGDGDGDGDGD